MDGKPEALAHRQHRSAHPAGQHQGVAVPSLADEFILLWGCSEGIRPLGEVGSPGLPSRTTSLRAGRWPEAALKTLPHLEHAGGTTRFLAVTLFPQRGPPPNRRKYLVLWVLGTGSKH